MNLVWEGSPHVGGPFNVMLALADNADDVTGYCYPGVEYLAWKTRQSTRNVQYSLKQLAEEGWIKIEVGTGPMRCNEYFLNIPRMQTSATERRRVFEEERKKKKGAKVAPSNPFHATVQSGTETVQPAQERVQPETLRVQPATARVQPATPEGAIALHPNHHRTTMEPLTPSASLGEGNPDSRWTEIREDLKGYWEYCNPGVPMPFDGKVDGKALKIFLKRNPTLTRPLWKRCLWNRARSEVPHAEDIHRWILTLLKFSECAFDGYGKKITTGGGRKHDDAQQLIDANRASGDAWLEQRRKGRAGEGVSGRVRGALGAPDPGSSA